MIRWVLWGAVLGCVGRGGGALGARIGYRALFRDNVNFRRLFWARLVSLFGDWFHLMAVLALLRQMGVHSASAFGWVLILKLLPGALAAPVAGMVADRFSRRKIMMTADVLRSVVVFAMLGQIWWPSVPVLYALVALNAVIGAFFDPARGALLPDVVSDAELAPANAVNAAVWSSMLTLGSAAGGLWTAYFGWEAALTVDALSYLLAMVFLLRLEEPNWREDASDEVVAVPGWRRLLGIDDILAGFAYTAKRPQVWTLALVKWGWALSIPSPLLLAILGERVFAVPGMPILAVTVLYVFRGLGTGGGPFLSRWLSKDDPARMERMVLVGFCCGGLFYFTVVWAGSLWLAAIFVLLAHLGGATVWVFSTVRLQQIVPSQWRGRVFSMEQMAFTLASFASTWSFGALVDAKVIPPIGLVMVSGGLLLLVACLWGLRCAWLGWATNAVSDT